MKCCIPDKAKLLRQAQSGVSLIELMIALTLGLVVIGTMASIFADSSRARTEIQKTGQQRESGRHASQTLTDHLRLAGYLGGFDPTPLPAPASLPDPCATSAADLADAMPLAIQGIDDVTVTDIPSCLAAADVKLGTDLVVIRRAAECVASTGGGGACEADVTSVPYLQVSTCYPTDGSSTELASGNFADHFVLDDGSSTGFNLRKIDCTTTADIHRYLSRIYFIANNNKSGDGIPTLKYWEAGIGIVPLADGIDNLQVEYGLDTNNDGSPDAWLNAGTPDDPSDPTAPSLDEVADWAQIVATRTHVLSRSREQSPGYTDTRTYTLGDTSLGPFDDHYKRSLFSTTAELVNLSWRRR